jgi:hypothetical protein
MALTPLIGPPEEEEARRFQEEGISARVGPAPPGGAVVEAPGMFGGRFEGDPRELAEALDMMGAGGGSPDADVMREEMIRSGEMDRMLRKYGTPPEDFEAPDFSAAGRKSFRQHSIDTELDGVDPYLINPETALENAEREIWPQVFERFFGGTVLWRDRDRLDSKQEKAMQEELRRFRAFHFNRAKMNREYGMKLLEDRLEDWDKKAEEYNRVRSQVMKNVEADRRMFQQDAIIRRRQADAAARKAPRMLAMPNERGAWNFHEWRDGKWVDTGKGADKAAYTPEKGPSPASIGAAMRWEAKQLVEIDEGAQIPPAIFDAINKIREAYGLPLLVEREITEHDKGILGLDWGWLGAGDETTYEYEEESIEAAIKKEYPNAYMGDDGEWYTVQGNKKYRIDTR